MKTPIPLLALLLLAGLSPEKSGAVEAGPEPISRSLTVVGLCPRTTFDRCSAKLLAATEKNGIKLLQKKCEEKGGSLEGETSCHTSCAPAAPAPEKEFTDVSCTSDCSGQCRLP